MPDDRPRCPRCHKRTYHSWSKAQHDCRLIRRHNKRLRTLRVYYSRRCRAFHLTKDKRRKD